jgi:hypothetical protein
MRAAQSLVRHRPGGPVRWAGLVTALLVVGVWPVTAPGSPVTPHPVVSSLSVVGLPPTASASSAGVVGITSFTASPNPDEVSVVGNLTVATAGGSGTLSYRYTGLPPYCLSANLSTLPCAPSAPGTYQVTVTVNDTAGGGAVATLTWTVHGRLQVGPMNLNPPVTDSYQGEQISLNISGGVGPFRFNWSGLPDECIPNGTAFIHCYPGDAKEYLIAAVVTDVLGLQGSAGALFSVVAPPLVTHFLVLPSNVSVGGTVTLVTLGRAGTGWTTYNYSGLPPGCVSVNASFMSCVPTKAGVYNLTVVATDEFNGASERNGQLNVSPVRLPVPQLVEFLASPGQIVLGQTAVVLAVVVNGTPPWNVSYTGLPPGCSSASTLTLSCQPTAAGNYTIHMAGRDATGASVVGETELRVSPPVPPATIVKQSSGTVSETLLEEGSAAGLVLGAVVGWVIGRRLRSRSPEGGDPG